MALDTVRYAVKTAPEDIFTAITDVDKNGDVYVVYNEGPGEVYLAETRGASTVPPLGSGIPIPVGKERQFTLPNGSPRVIWLWGDSGHNSTVKVFESRSS